MAIIPGAASLIGPEIIAKYQVLPLDFDAQTVTVALGDPSSVDVIDVLRLRAQRRITKTS